MMILMVRHAPHWKIPHPPPTHHVITVRVAVTHRAASFGIVIGHFRVGPRNRCGDDVLGIARHILGRPSAFQLCESDGLSKIRGHPDCAAGL